MSINCGRKMIRNHAYSAKRVSIGSPRNRPAYIYLLGVV